MTEPRKTDPAVKKALVYVLFLDLIAIGAFLALWFGTHNPIYSAIPIAIAGPLVAIMLWGVAMALIVWRTLEWPTLRARKNLEPNSRG